MLYIKQQKPYCAEKYCRIEHKAFQYLAPAQRKKCPCGAATGTKNADSVKNALGNKGKEGANPIIKNLENNCRRYGQNND